jgi:hypothetical protein
VVHGDLHCDLLHLVVGHAMLAGRGRDGQVGDCWARVRRYDAGGQDADGSTAHRAAAKGLRQAPIAPFLSLGLCQLCLTQSSLGARGATSDLILDAVDLLILAR